MVVGVVCFSLIWMIWLACAIFRSSTDAVSLESIILVNRQPRREISLFLRRGVRRTGITYVGFDNFFSFGFSQYVEKYLNILKEN